MAKVEASAQGRPSPQVGIIVLSWNNYTDTAECLDSLRGISYPNYRVILVDNGSTDGSAQTLKVNFPEVCFIQNQSNLGFSGGNNVGIREAIEQGADYILLLNNDVIADKQLLTELVSVFQQAPEAGILGGVNYYYAQRNKIQFSGGVIDWERGRISDISRHRIDRGQFENVREVDTVLGSCLFISSLLVQAIGLLDERYFLNFEETDWCCRAKEKGYRVYACMNAKVWHKVSVSARDKKSGANIMIYYVVRNTYLFLIKNSPRPLLFISLPYHTLRTGKEVLVELFHGNFAKARLLRLGLMDGLMGRFGNCLEIIGSQEIRHECH